MNGYVSILGTAVLALLVAGYFGQKFLPPPKPKVVGIDLGTTYSCIGIYHSVSGNVTVLPVQGNHKCIPSIVAFRDNQILVGYDAFRQMEQNPLNTIYDSKRFIGRQFGKEEFEKEASNYPFKMHLNETGHVRFEIGEAPSVKSFTPEEIGSFIVKTLREAAEKQVDSPLLKCVMGAPAEFDDAQRNATKRAAVLAGMDVFRVISEPTAAAMAYGLHKKQHVDLIVVVDVGGGTTDVSLLSVQAGMFFTQALAGNNRLGGQDFNNNLLRLIRDQVEKQFGRVLVDRDDLQKLHLEVEEVKLALTNSEYYEVNVMLASMGGRFEYRVTRDEFEAINEVLFQRVVETIDRALHAASASPADVDEVVMVGGSTRVPRIRHLVQQFFGRPPNTAIDPELAVTTGLSVQAGILGGAWPLQVSAVERPTNVRKISL